MSGVFVAFVAYVTVNLSFFYITLHYNNIVSIRSQMIPFVFQSPLSVQISVLRRVPSGIELPVLHVTMATYPLSVTTKWVLAFGMCRVGHWIADHGTLDICDTG